MAKFIDLTGSVYGRLKAIRLAGTKMKGKKPVTLWECVCECGNKKIVCVGDLRNGLVKSCGCLRKERTTKKQCRNCGKDFVIPLCRDGREHCCSSECKRKLKSAIAEEKKLQRTRSCLHCGNSFVPRSFQIKSGEGKYCSKKCLIKVMVANSHVPESNKKRVDSFMATMDGKFPKGENHPNWKGGYSATYKRLKESGKFREWASYRKDRKHGRLPNGTVKNLYASQKERCAICRSKLNNKYHIDHINPLFLGGKHEPENIQILCPTCNLKKGAKDPIVFMQERGYLL